VPLLHSAQVAKTMPFKRSRLLNMEIGGMCSSVMVELARVFGQ
jgi:hypothetical protein